MRKKIFNNTNDDSNDVGLNLGVERLEADNQENVEISEHRNLNIIIPAFDPGIENNEKVFQELRNFEARRFAVKLKVALENTNPTNIKLSIKNPYKEIINDNRFKYKIQKTKLYRVNLNI